MFDQEIKIPQHDKIVLGTTHARVLPANRVALGHIMPGPEDEPLILDENDAIRLAAFLNRWFTERSRAEQRAEGEQIRANREAKKQRHEARKAMPQ